MPTPPSGCAGWRPRNSAPPRNIHSLPSGLTRRTRFVSVPRPTAHWGRPAPIPRSWRSPPVPNLELWLILLLLAGLVVGGWSISWARTGRAGRRASWGRGLFVVTLLALGGSNMLAAFHR